MIHHAVSGLSTGSPLLLIHGFMEDSSVFEPWLSSLREQHLLVVVDLGGYGSRIHEPFVSIDHQAAQLSELLQSIHPNGWKITGHSMGGYIALAMLEQQPELIDELMFVNSHAMADGEERKANRTRLAEAVLERGTGLLLDGFHRSLFAPENTDKFSALIEEFRRKAECISPQTVAECALSMRDRPDRSHLLAQLRKVTILHGLQDQSVSTEHVLQMAAKATFCELHLLPHVGHMAMYENR